MSDPFRSGGFDSIGFGPFNTGGGDFSRYNIGDDGDQVAQTRKYSAQLAWANGTITDDAYLGELRRYLGTTEKGSRERISAQNEYDDAVYSIGRNKIVRAVNQAASSTLRVAALRRLIAYDRRKLGTMVGNNEQARELRDRISDAEAQVRSARYADLYRRYQADRLSTSALLSYARNAAAGSRGGPDHEDWLDKVRQLTDMVDNEKLAALYQDYEHDRIPGATVIDALQARLAGMDPSSPDYAETKRSIEDLTKQVRERERAEMDARMARRVQNGDVSTGEYLRYLRRRVDDYPKGSSERRSAEDEWMNATFSYGEADMKRKLAAGEITEGEAAGFYRSYMAGMEPTSERFLSLQQTVNDLLAGARTTLFDQSVGGYYGAGHRVSLSGAPGGTPVNAAGFASQFDGSAFGSSNCGMASAAMLAWAASGGKIRVSGGDLRYYSGDRDQNGDERGTTYDDITIALKNVGLGLKQFHGMDFTAWKRRLLAGEGSLISGHYMDAPENLRLTNSASFTHTMYVDRAKKVDGKVWFFVMDPLGRSGYSGQWWPEEAMRQYGWSGRANAGGGQWFGDVAFAAGKGRSGSFVTPDRDPPRFQAFDTDADGRSTVGRGGGTNRKEAGRRRDWSKGKQAEAPTTWPQYQLPAEKKDGKPDNAPKVTEEQVGEFLAAVDSVVEPSLTSPDQWGVRRSEGVQRAREQDRRAAAEAILSKWDGDARLAAAEWFTGSADPDASTWDRSQRFYANAIGTRLGYDPVTTGTLQPMPTPGMLDQTTQPRSSFDQRDTLGDAEAGKAARDIGTILLQRLGVQPTPDMVRAVNAWVATHAPTVVGNNPGSLLVTGTNDLPGQLGKDAEGHALFGSLDDGVAAWADEIIRTSPGIVSAARSNDPERFLIAVDKSGWVEGGYGGSLIRTYNEMPGDHPKIIGGMGRLIPATTDLTSLARSVPSIMELLEVDARDPVQMAWLEKNVQAAKDARDAGTDQWVYTTPGGQEVQLDFHPAIASDLTYARATYYEQAYTLTRDRTYLDKATAAMTDHNKGVAKVGGDEWQKQMELLDLSRQAALGRGDFKGYRDTTFVMADATKRYLQMDPGAPLDPSRVPQAMQEAIDDAGLWNKVLEWGDRLDVRDTSSGDLSTMNANGDPVLEAFQKQYIRPDGSLDPNQAAVFWTEEGDLKLETVETNADLFAPGDPLSTLDREATQTPAYLQRTIQFTTAQGRTGRIAPSPGEVLAVVLTTDYRTATAPAAVAPTPGAAPNSLTSLMSPSGHMPLPGTANISPWLMSGAKPAKGRVISVADRADMMEVSTRTTVPVRQITLRNPDTGRLEVWYSIDDGRNQWLGGEVDYSGAKHPPRVVLGAADPNDPSAPRVTLNAAGQVLIGDEPWEESKHGPLSKYAHWYGTQASDGAPPGSIGARDTAWRLRQGSMAGPYGSVTIDAAPPDARTAFLEGDISFDTFMGMARGIKPLTPGGYRLKDDAARAGRAPLGPPDTRDGSQRDALPFNDQRRQAAARAVVEYGGFDRILNPPSWEETLAQQIAGTLPLTAGAGPQPPRFTAPGNLSSFGARLAAGVKAGAQAALDVANAQRQLAIAQQQQAAIIARREADRRAALAQVKQRVDWSSVSASTAAVPRLDPKPAPKKDPVKLGYDPIPTPPPPVKPPTIPPPKAPPPSRGPQSEGMY